MKRFTLCLFVLLASVGLVAVSSAPAYAVDGVVLINQNTISSGGLPGCPAASTGAHIIICQPGSYRLSGNLTVTDGYSVIVITTDNVSLDLNGFAILGPNTCTGMPVTSCTQNTFGYGIAASSQDNVTVRNGSVIGMGGGIFLYPGNGYLVEDIHTKWSAFTGIYISSGNVRHCTATQNGESGILVGDHGVVEGNTAEGNKVAGLGGFDSSVVGNSSRSNGYGLMLYRSTWGSNSLQDNGALLYDFGQNTSQNNNNCNGSAC